MRALVKAFVHCAWAIIGLVFWPPLLARSVATFCLQILVAAFAGHQDVSGLGVQLDLAIRFYPDGFKKISQALGRSTTPSTTLPRLPLERIGIEIVWAVLFYIGFFSLLFAFAQIVVWLLIVLDLPKKVGLVLPTAVADAAAIQLPSFWSFLGAVFLAILAFTIGVFAERVFSSSSDISDDDWFITTLKKLTKAKKAEAGKRGQSGVEAEVGSGGSGASLRREREHGSVRGAGSVGAGAVSICESRSVIE